MGNWDNITDSLVLEISTLVIVKFVKIRTSSFVITFVMQSTMDYHKTKVHICSFIKMMVQLLMKESTEYWLIWKVLILLWFRPNTLTCCSNLARTRIWIELKIFSKTERIFNKLHWLIIQFWRSESDSQNNDYLHSIF